MRTLHHLFFITICLFLSLSIPVWSAEKKLKPDWMLDDSQYKAEIMNRSGDLIVTNGLIERTFRNGTTIGLKNLVTNEGLLRSIRPEAELTIDGVKLDVGGFVGQPIHNYFLTEWLDKMHPDSMALQYEGYEETEIQKRFDWKPRTEWMTSHPAWPPKGKCVSLKFKADDKLIKRIAARYSSDESRPVYFNEDFRVLNNEWKVFTSKSNTANSFNNEGKPGEMLVAANTAVYAERSLDPNTEILISRISPGTDRSMNCGPGMVWIFNNKSVKFYTRTAEGKFGLSGVGLEYEASFDGLRKGEPVYLKMQREKQTLFCSYSYDNKVWTPIYQLQLPADAVSKSVRVGKTGKDKGADEDKNIGEIGRSRIDLVKASGSIPSYSPASKEFEYLKNLEISVNYEIYDGIPLICKWVNVKNNSPKEVVINTYKSEILAVAEPENTAIFDKSVITPNITVESDFAHCQKHDYKNPDFNRATQRHVHWNRDKNYSTQTDWLLKLPCLLEAYPEYGPDYDLAQGDSFDTQRTWELFHDSRERERKNLQIRKMYRTAAPWVVENPIFMHVRSADNKSMKKAIDQCADVGFEMVIMTFGSGVDIENNSKENLDRMKELTDYAHSKNIAIGGYSLLASRSINKDNDVVMPQPDMKPMFDNSPCVESEWGQKYMANIREYFEKTGQDILEHDGSYPGDECASTSHPGHKGLNDSQWKQYKTIKEFYHWCKSQGIFLNIPDWYFMNGQNKTGMGYRETNWSLPREQQEIIERQNIYDGTWNKTPSMGWMMVPLVEYHGGGAAATIEPLNEHLPHYDMRLANNFGAGVMACYRGPQLYDTPQTRAVVKKWVDLYKAHRAIFDSDIVHLRRPDGTDWDGILHVNHLLKEKGLMMLYNPLPETVKRTIEVPVYYTGLSDKAMVRKETGKAVKHQVSRDYKIIMEVEIPAKGYTWYTFE